MKTFLFGMIFGVFAIFFGLFAGLQVSTILGNILMFPVIAISAITGTPFGMMTRPMFLFAMILTLVAWGLVFVLIRTLWHKFRA